MKPILAHQPLALASLGLAIEHAPLPMAVVEGAGHIVRCVNPAFCRLVGKPSERLIGMPLAETMPATNESLALLDRVFSTAKAENHTEQQRSEPHSVFWSYAVWPVLAGKQPVGAMIQVTETAQRHEKTVAMNEALVLGSLRQHELTEVADALNVQLQSEVAERKQAEELLRRNHDTFFNLIENAPFGLYVVDGQFRLRQVSAASRTAFSSVRPLIGRDFEEVVRTIWPDPFASEVLGRFRYTLETGEPYAAPNSTQQRHDNADVESYDWKIERITLPDGQFGVVCYFYDITERNQTEAALRESEERYRTLFDLGPVAVYSCDASGVIQNFNRRAAELWDREPALGDTDARFCGSFNLFRPDGSFVPHEQSLMADVLSGKLSEVRDAEVLIERPDGSRVTVVVNIRPLKNQRGETTGAINCFYDISERKEAEQRQSFLSNELAHRGKNLLAVVISIAFRSLSEARPLAEARDILIQRLHALARGQSVLMSEDFKGAPLTEIVRLEFESFSDRVRAVGPHVMLNPRVAQTFALLVHELATNASKYGALSLPDGRIAIQWSIDGVGAEARFRFQWQELDGPPVVPPIRRGFGRMVTEMAVAQEFGAPPKVRFTREGLTYEIDAPLVMVAATAATTRERRAATPQAGNFMGFSTDESRLPPR